MFSSNTLAMPLFYLFRDSPETPQGKDTTQIRTSKVPKENPEASLICRECRQIITRPADRISVDGSFRHTFSNPYGIVYEIGCFQSVIGCGMVGPPSNEFAWFKGYFWHLLICIGCRVHLGWSFSNGTGDMFYGLILDRLISSV